MEPRPSAPGVDLDLLGYHLHWWRWLVCVVLVAGMIGLVVGSGTAAELRLASDLPVVLFACYPAAYLVLIVGGPRLFTDERLRWIPGVLLFYATGTIAAVGACSSLSISPAYVTLLWIPPCWGALFPSNVAIAASLAASPVVLRALTVPGATHGSLAIAAMIGVAAAGAFLAFSWRRFMLRARRHRELAAEALGAATVTRAADHWTALRLHDRLSGVVMLARARGDDPALARLVVERARATLQDPPRGAPMRASESASALGGLARALGIGVSVSVRAPDRPATAWAELHDLVVELVSNHARHGAGVLRVRLTMRAGIARARVGADSSSPLMAPGGRGRRGLALRTDALGGVIRWRTSGRGWDVTISVPALDPSPGLRSAIRAVEVGAHAVPLGLAAITNVAVAVVLGAITVVLAAMQAADLRRDRAAHDARRAALRTEIDHAAALAVRRSREVLSPLIDQLERASAAERPDALAQLAREMHELMARLEHVSAVDRAARA